MVLSKENDQNHKYYNKFTWKCMLIQDIIRAVPMEDQPIAIQLPDGFELRVKDSVSGPVTTSNKISEQFRTLFSLARLP